MANRIGWDGAQMNIRAEDWNMIEQIIDFLGPNNVIAVLLVWNILGAIYHYKWEKRVNKALFEE